MTQTPNQILGKFMIFYGVVFVMYSVSSISIIFLNTQNFNLFWSFYVPLFFPHVFVYETLFTELGVSGDTLGYLVGIIIGVFGMLSFFSAFRTLKTNDLALVLYFG